MYLVDIQCNIHVHVCKKKKKKLEKKSNRYRLQMYIVHNTMMNLNNQNFNFFISEFLDILRNLYF